MKITFEFQTEEQLKNYINGPLTRGQASQIIPNIRRDIMLGIYPQNTKITELGVAARYSVSRSIARQTIAQLENEGFLKLRSNGCKYSVTFTPEDIIDLYNMREYYETAALETIYSSGIKQPEKMQKMIKTITENEGMSRDDILLLDIDFHRTVISMSENKFLLKGYESIASTFLTFLCILDDYNPTGISDIFTEQHLSIANALLSGDWKECRRIYANHYQGSGQRAARDFTNILKKIKTN